MLSRIGASAAVLCLFVTMVSFRCFVASAAAPAASTFSVTGVQPVPIKGLNRLSFVDTNTVFTSYGPGRSATTLIRQDNSSFTIFVENYPEQIVCDGNKLFMLCVIGRDDGESRGVTSTIKEYDLDTGEFIRDVIEQDDEVDVIHVYKGDLYLLRKVFSPLGAGDGSALAVHTIPLNGSGDETSYTIDTSIFTGAVGSCALKVFPLQDALYCWIFSKTSAANQIIKIDLHGTLLDTYHIPNLLDICIIPQGPSLGFICFRNRKTGEYRAGFLSLNGSDRTPVTTDFVTGKVRLYDMLVYDPLSHAFIIRGGVPSGFPGTYGFFRIGLTGTGD